MLKKKKRQNAIKQLLKAIYNIGFNQDKNQNNGNSLLLHLDSHHLTCTFPQQHFIVHVNWF